VTVRLAAQRSAKDSIEILDTVGLLRLEVAGVARGWLCGDDNTAAYGSCVASSYRRLELVGPQSATDGIVLLYPGLLFTVSVFKMDTYGQVC
jgi:hypothetical protein